MTKDIGFQNQIKTGSILEFASKVADSLVQKRPIVALESTIITHGICLASKLQDCAISRKYYTPRGCSPCHHCSFKP